MRLYKLASSCTSWCSGGWPKLEPKPQKNVWDNGRSEIIRHQ
jgi:hypothetical protein